MSLRFGDAVRGVPQEDRGKFPAVEIEDNRKAVEGEAKLRNPGAVAETAHVELQHVEPDEADKPRILQKGVVPAVLARGVQRNRKPEEVLGEQLGHPEAGGLLAGCRRAQEGSGCDRDGQPAHGEGKVTLSQCILILSKYTITTCGSSPSPKGMRPSSGSLL